MKSAIVLFFLALVGAAFACETTEDLHRELRSAVNKINSDVDSTWRAESYEKFMNLDVESVKKSMGALHQDTSSYPSAEYDLPIAVLPTEFQAAKTWPECKSISVISDQSSCGSCWAISTANGGSDRICIATKGQSQPYLSTRDLLSCCSSCGSGCNGGYPLSAWDWFTSKGVVTGGLFGNFTQCVSYPFQPCGHHTDSFSPSCDTLDYKTPKCQTTCDGESTYTVPYAKDKIFFKNAYNVRGEENMMNELMTNGPYTVTLSVYSDFLTYKSGVYKKVTGSYLGGHAVRLVGWGVDEITGTKYWSIANSWNESWGEKGIFRILRGANECGIESGGSAGLYQA